MRFFSPGRRPKFPWRVMAGMGLALSCASSADLEALYQNGITAARADDWKTAIENLESYADKACTGRSPGAHCRETYLALGRGYERRGTPARAWVAFDTALSLPPHDRDANVRESLARAEQELRDRRQPEGAHGPVIVRYRDEVTDEYTPRFVRVLLDLDPVFTKDKGAADLRSAEFTKVFGGPVPAGAHVLLVEVAHGCKPGEARCAGSVIHRSWTFDNHAKAPVTLEVRAFAGPGDGKVAAKPALDMEVR